MASLKVVIGQEFRKMMRSQDRESGFVLRRDINFREWKFSIAFFGEE